MTLNEIGDFKSSTDRSTPKLVPLEEEIQSESLESEFQTIQATITFKMPRSVRRQEFEKFKKETEAEVLEVRKEGALSDLSLKELSDDNTQMISELNDKVGDALKSANDAKSAGVELKDKVSDAQRSADEAKTIGVAAQATADSSKTKSDAALKKGQEAEKKAGDAFKKGEEAEKKAGDAQRTGERALLKADTALDDAEERISWSDFCKFCIPTIILMVVALFKLMQIYC
jgi:hypothetical protein